MVDTVEVLPIQLWSGLKGVLLGGLHKPMAIRLVVHWAGVVQRTSPVLSQVPSELSSRPAVGCLAGDGGMGLWKESYVDEDLGTMCMLSVLSTFTSDLHGSIDHLPVHIGRLGLYDLGGGGVDRSAIQPQAEQLVVSSM